MISRILTRALGAALPKAQQARSLLAVSQFSFAREVKKAGTNFTKVLDDEISAEESNLTDLSEHQARFSDKGWALQRDATLVELSKTTGAYTVRVLSNIKSPSQFNEGEEEGQQDQEGEGQEDYKGEMNEVTICVSKQGSEQTMVVHTIVTEGFEITSVNFAKNYQEAKKGRLDIFSSNTYTGPEMESLSDELFEGIYSFLEQDCEITEELLEAFGDYCIEAEQSFYIGWLKDLKSML
jgi:hypothetical protein